MALTKIKIGDRFGRLTVIAYAGHERSKNGSSKLLIKCKCDCGNVIITRSNNLTRGDTKSCGCYSKEVARETHLGKAFRHLEKNKSRLKFFHQLKINKKMFLCK